jgi:predicted dehydrogenase
MLWASQVAPGNENNLRLRVYGEKAGIEWKQEDPNYLRFTPYGQPPVSISRSGPAATASSKNASRIPSGHPEGYLEAFAQLYADLAEQMAARRAGRPALPSSLLVPNVVDGVAGVHFMSTVLESSRQNSAWMKVPPSFQPEGDAARA